jgi:hypothetical protein
MIPKLTRRSVVAMATVGVAAGCAPSGGKSAGASLAKAPGMATQAQAVRDSTALVARYDAVAAAHPSLAGRLAPLRADTASHVRAFGGGAPPAASATATHAVDVPADSSKALASLATAERRLADRRAAALLDAPADLARLLASVAACGAGHVALLGSSAEK